MKSIFLLLALCGYANAGSGSINDPVVTDAASFQTLAVSTVACGATAALVVAVSSQPVNPISNINGFAVGTRFCNEGTSAVRIGPSTITATVGAVVFASSCVSLDVPRLFQGALYCIATSGTQASSTIQARP